jgi:hypothetical protein
MQLETQLESLLLSDNLDTVNMAFSSTATQCNCKSTTCICIDPQLTTRIFSVFGDVPDASLTAKKFSDWLAMVLC